VCRGWEVRVGNIFLLTSHSHFPTHFSLLNLTPKDFDISASNFLVQSTKYSCFRTNGLPHSETVG